MRRGAFTLLACALLVTGMASAAWAPHVAQLKVEPQQVEPGDTLRLEGPAGFGPSQPVEIHFGELDGPVIGTFTTNGEFFAAWSGEVTVPDDAEPGTYTLFATQELTDEEAYIRGLPARATIVVGEGEPATVVQELNPRVERDPVAVDDAPGVGTLVLLGLGVAAVALLVAYGVAQAAGRRRDAATVEGGRR